MATDRAMTERSEDARPAPIRIGIDGGGTGCRVAVAVGDTAPVEAKGGPANIVTDPDRAAAHILDALSKVLASHGRSQEDLADARICAGLAGGRLPGMAEAFAARLPFAARVVDDSVTALEGALGARDGTLASLGTGSFFIRKAGDRVRHLGGWGLQLGDEGSAAWLGRRALALALRVADGRLPPDPLADALIAATLPHPVIFARSASPGDYARLAKRVLERDDTPLAARLIADTVAALEEGLRDVGHRPGAPLVLTGGLGDLLAPRLPAALARDLTPALGRPLDGALALARRLP
jgi:glucosamine kinase